MTGVTEVSCAEAEPLGNITAVSTFEFDIVLSMCITVRLPSKHLGSTFSAYEVLLLEISSSFVQIPTFLQTSIVWIFALETCVVRQACHRILGEVLIVVIPLFAQSLIFVQSFNFSSLDRFLSNVILHLRCFSDQCMDLWMVRGIDLSLTGGAS